MKAHNQLDALVGFVERATRFDPAADKVAIVAKRLLPDGWVKDSASGTSLGHPLHPALVGVPIGCWLAAGYLDFSPARDAHDDAVARRLAQRFVALGVAASVPTAIAGVSDWLDTASGERRVGLVHGAVNVTALVGYTGSWLLRRAKHHRAGAAVAVASLGLVGVAGWLGAHLVFAAGVGVDTTAFQKLPSRWTDTGLTFEELDSGTAVAVDLAGVQVLVYRSGRSVHAVANRCTHRGGPLDEGEIADGCVTCPWHGSRFDLADGSLLRGPATRPQPALEGRVTKGHVQVRRTGETRALRVNPVGV